MPALRLFANVYQVDGTARDYPLGSAKLSLQLVAGPVVRVWINGPFAGLIFKQLTFDLKCRVAGNDIEPLPGDANWTGTIDFKLGPSTIPLGFTKITVPAPDQQLGVVLVTPRASEFGTAAKIANTGWLKPSEWSLDWTSTLMSPNASKGVVEIWPRGGAPYLTVKDRFSRTPTGTQVIQEFVVERMRMSDDAFDVLFWPHSNAVYLNGDVLDPTRPLDLKENGYHFQHVVSEAHLATRIEFSFGTWVNGGWSLVPAEVGGAMRLATPALMDEHGHPLIFSVDDRLPLSGRQGHVKPTVDPQGETNQAIVIGDSMKDLQVAARLETVDPVVLYKEPQTPQPLKNKRLQPPYWVRGRSTPLQGKRPREVLGFAADAALIFDAPVAKGAVGARSPQVVALHFKPIRDGSNGLRFIFPTVEIPLQTTGAQATAFAMQLPEQATYQTRGGVKTLEVSRRVAIASQPTLVLPMLDPKWAFSNLGSAQDPKDGLAEQGAKWLQQINKDMRDAFSKPDPTDYEHIEGLRVAPTQLPLLRVLAPAPTTTRTADGAFDPRSVGQAATVLASGKQPMRQSALTAWSVPTPNDSADFLFGGPSADSLAKRVRARAAASTDPFKQPAMALAAGRTAFDGPLENFYWFWTGDPRGTPPAGWQTARQHLWDYLVGLRPALPSPDDWSFDDLIEASERLESARDALARNPPDVLGFDVYDEALKEASPDEIGELLDPDRGSGLLERLLQFAYAPPTMELANRAIAALGSKTLADDRAILEAFITDQLTNAVNDYFKGLKEAPQGLLAELLQGLPPIFEFAQGVWRDRDQLAGEMREQLIDLAARFGAELTHEVYAELLKEAVDAETFAQILRDMGVPLARLADLAGEPPDYLIISRRLRRPDSGDPNADSTRLHPLDRVAALWNHRFDFCTFGGSKAWDMFLDDQTTLIIKLGGTRGFPEILKEVTNAYADKGRADPFMLDPQQGDDPVAAFVGLLPEELQLKEWRGTLIINPKIDLDRDPVLKTLCGFSHIAARFAAVGGRAPEGSLPVALDVWGRIEKVAEVAGWTSDVGQPQNAPPTWGNADVAWSLIRFSATVKGTTILSGDISFKLDIRELFGRRFDWDPITISGTLPPTTGSVTGKPRDFSFAATFDTPRSLEIDVAFIDQVKFKGIRVGSHDGDTTLDNDADIICQDWNLGAFNFEASQPLNLSDFRIRIPEVEGGRAIAMGLMRGLSFDLRGIRFPLADPRRITIAGLDIRPVGVGLLRGKPDEIRSRLAAETVPLVEPTFVGGSPDSRYGYPYFDTQIEFGRTPTLDGAGQFSLVARTGVSVASSDDPKKKPQFGKPGVGLASLSGRNLKISLFRLLTIEFEEIDAGVFTLADGKKAGAIWADGFNLSILSWQLFKNEDDAGKKKARTLVYAHDTADARNRGFLAWYASPGAADGFFKLQWLLVAQNIGLDKKLLDALLDLTKADLANEIKAIQGLKQKDKLNFKLDREFGWLFGIRFELGELFKPCALIFHDGVYYGIRLGGPIAKLITGEEDISLAYIPGDTPQLDRFRVALRIAALDMMGVMESGEIALEWNPAWDFLIDLGQPWRGPNGYMWERAFSIPMGVYEAKFGFFVEKRTSIKPPEGLPPAPAGYQDITLSAGAGFYFGYAFSTPRSIAWVRAGIGVFGVLVGSATLRAPQNIGNNPLALLKTSLAKLSVTGVLGVYAYGEGGVDVWILSARFRVSAQAFVEIVLVYIPNARSYLTYNATLAAAYSASVRVGSGIFSWTFSVSGAVQMSISGNAAFG
ncbi:hypothetical protein [Mesorhizobium sp. M6A.T.Cr.TU.016.01.1.1]|uniref:hypothetical protein n=1 Tax=Mesorhizobium sp. M6A.T.Cr.TU.016.01.1.1 TaxID=2493677 RepID=UPI000F75198B|nr:hypothetical protein [Mesorhizobium sp. M6A.T.Cr.TU.016.01.1.1]AZO68001.1 hypothetical protein EJ075_25840 [Mesorhizobium sp. M6A.T.Cr.TU.016.01.1.1]